jgi:23S rRNA (cytosine1962-C5)-methyltransferase
MQFCIPVGVGPVRIPGMPETRFDPEGDRGEDREASASPEAAPSTQGPPVPWVRTRRRPLSPPHPWVYRRMVRETSPGLSDGDEVQVLASDGTPVGRGLWSGRSMIAVRILDLDPERPLDEAFFRDRIARAAALRRDHLALDRITDAYRVVHSEGDDLSGIIVDRYGDSIVIEYFSFALHARHPLIRRLLEEAFPGARVTWRADRDVAEKEGIRGAQPPPGQEVEIRENKMRFLVRPGGGHKTGFFLDQRENRERFASLARGRKVLDCFCYTGAFSIASRTLGRAREVTGVDLDEEALETARRNAALNRAEVRWEHADAFKFLRAQRNAADPFEAVVLDPAKWATSRDRIDDARLRYRDINLAGIRVLRKGGILLTCSCSGLVSEEDFLSLVRAAAAQANRSLQIFHLGGAAGDHPVSIHCPESRYLKAVFARVS